MSYPPLLLNSKSSSHLVSFPHPQSNSHELHDKQKGKDIREGQGIRGGGQRRLNVSGKSSGRGLRW